LLFLCSVFHAMSTVLIAELKTSALHLMSS